MKRILLDTNLILDIALKRTPHFENSSRLFELIYRAMNAILKYFASIIQTI